MTTADEKIIWQHNQKYNLLTLLLCFYSDHALLTPFVVIAILLSEYVL